MYDQTIGYLPHAMEMAQYSYRMQYDVGTRNQVTRTNCHCHSEESQPKILQSLLGYQLGAKRQTMSPGRQNSCGSPHSNCSTPRSSLCPSPSTSSRSSCPSPRSHCSSPQSSAEGRSFCSSPMTQGCSSPSSSIYESKLFSMLSKSKNNSTHSSAMRSVANTDQEFSNKRSYSMSSCDSADEPMDLSCKRQKSVSHQHTVTKTQNYDFSMSTSKDCSSKDSSSILKAILCGSQHATPKSTPTLQKTPQTFVPSKNTDSQRVTLAKKNLFPVSARVSDWLVKLVQFAKSLPEFASLSHNEKVTLLLNSWARIMLLLMAENNFEFAVTPVHTKDSKAEEEKQARNLDPEIPTMRSVEAIQAFIHKCQSLGLDSKEFTYLRMATLFNPGCYITDNPSYIDSVNGFARQALQEHISNTRPTEKMRYSQILLCLPSLYGINCKVVENLFCRHISGGTDTEVLLKEMLQKL